jgi:hypothetical protein
MSSDLDQYARKCQVKCADLQIHNMDYSELIREVERAHAHFTVLDICWLKLLKLQPTIHFIILEYLGFILKTYEYIFQQVSSIYI